MKRCTVKAEDKRYAFQTCKAACGSCGERCLDDDEWHKAGEPRVAAREGPARRPPRPRRRDKTCAWVNRFTNRCEAAGEDLCENQPLSRRA